MAEPQLDKFERLGELASQLGEDEFISVCVVMAAKAYMYGVATEKAPQRPLKFKTRMRGIALTSAVEECLSVELLQELAIRRGQGLEASQLDAFYQRLTNQTSHAHVAAAKAKAAVTGHLYLPQTKLAKYPAKLSIQDHSDSHVKILRGVFDKRVLHYPADLSKETMVTSLPFGYMAD